MERATDFQPNWASTPGDTISDILREREISIASFAQKMGSTPEYVRELLKGYVAITHEIALKLERILGASVDFWLRREHQYREDILRIRRTDEIKWLEELPVSDMIKWGWIQQTQNKLKACLDFFGVPDILSWREKYREVVAKTSFRTSQTYKSEPAAVAAWIRQGEIKGGSIECRPWNEKLFEKTLNEIRPLTRKKHPKDFIPELIKMCAECGVAVAIVRTPTACRASGATMFVNPKRALMLLSFRYRSDDHFWFTFFHEAGHLILHGTKAIFIEEYENFGNISQQEDEANRFAGAALIPHELESLLPSIRGNQRNIIAFAMRAGISPGILIGQLQHRGFVSPKYLNGYKRRYSWEDFEFLNQPPK